jgi:hypothetical protein
MVLGITYAIPDTHGRLDLLVKAVELVAEDVVARGRPAFKACSWAITSIEGPESAQVVKLPTRRASWSATSYTATVASWRHEAATDQAIAGKTETAEP